MWIGNPEDDQETEQLDDDGYEDGEVLEGEEGDDEDDEEEPSHDPVSALANWEAARPKSVNPWQPTVRLLHSTLRYQLTQGQKH